MHKVEKINLMNPSSVKFFGFFDFAIKFGFLPWLLLLIVLGFLLSLSLLQKKCDNK
jgi:hypothetical protein